jgi:hypothetical protein
VTSRAVESAEQFENELGWRNLTQPLHSISQLDTQQDHFTHRFLMRLMRDYEVAQELMGMNLWDVALYRHIETLMALRKQAYYAQAYAEANQRAGCTLPCCEHRCMHNSFANPHMRHYDVGQEKAGRLLGAVTQVTIAPSTSAECRWLFVPPALASGSIDLGVY